MMTPRIAEKLLENHRNYGWGQFKRFEDLYVTGRQCSMQTAVEFHSVAGKINYRGRAINNRGHNSKILFLTLRLSHKKGIKIAF